MKLRLLAFDLDGTTINKHKHLSPENRAALLKAHEAGIIPVPATGRMRTFVPEEIIALPGVRYVITSNGAAVYDLKGNRPIIEHLIPHETAKLAQRVIDSFGVYVEYYSNGAAITKRGYPELAFTDFGMPEENRHFIEGKAYTFTDDFYSLLSDPGFKLEKINLPYIPREKKPLILDGLKKLSGLALTSSLEHNIEINSESANKGASLSELAGLLGLQMGEVMSIGDNGNDISMIKLAGVGVCVADGADEAKAAADYITEAPHDQNALSEAINKLIL